MLAKQVHSLVCLPLHRTTHKKLHLGNLLVDLLHELDDKIDKLVFEHLLSVEVCDEEGNIVALQAPESVSQSVSQSVTSMSTITNLDRLPPQDKKRLGTLRQEARKLVHQNILNLVRLLDADANSDRIDARLHQHALILIARYRQWRQQHLGRSLCLDLGYIVALRRLRRKVRQAQRRRQRAADRLEVGPEGLGL